MANTRKIKRDILDGESILHACTIHPAVFLYPAFLFGVALVIWWKFSIILAGVIGVIALFPLVNSTIIYLTTEYVVTDRRVMAYYGFFTTDLLQINLDRLEGASVEQDLLGRILRYYTVTARGTGTGGISIPFLSDGPDFKRKLDEMIYQDKNSLDL